MRNRPNYLSSILSVALVLLLLGFFALTALYGDRFVTLFKEKVDIWIELKPNRADTDVNRIISIVRNAPFVKKESVRYITREQVAATMREELGDERMIADLPQLMHDVVRCNVKAEYLTPDSLSEWRTTMRQDSAVADLFFEAINVGQAGRNLANIGFGALILSIFLVLAAITLIHNTIRLALYANRFVIKNQELVGASWGFITRPYLVRAFWNGLISGILAVGALAGLLTWLLRAWPELYEIHNPSGVTLICIGLVALGILISVLSTKFVVNKFLRMRLEDLY
jgi:cell division transport system permease protein